MYFFPYNGPYVMEDYLIVDQRGYAHMLREIAKPFVSEIRFGQHVSKVEYSDSSVVVTTKDGSIYTADYVISTLPLGVMKHRDAPTAVTFDPPFPADKLAAIDEMGMGNYAKVYLQFNRNFWGDTETFAIAGLPIEGVDKYLTWGINLDHPKYLPGSKILSFHMASDVARRIESQHAEVTQVQIMKELRFLFGEDIPDPLAIKTSDWLHFPLTFGSYSWWPIGFTEIEWMAMRRPEGRLFFAGEHTNSNYGFAHYAHISGKDAAKAIMKDMQGHVASVELGKAFKELS
mmetsp:Transcript_24836/g.41184  ORF Transcript_24836/g.41184 Transcript_24836/m.41184 type:complete len:288 (+) Transcript_24836:1-864(+)